MSHDHGSTTSSTTSSSHGGMIPYLHFTGGDTLFFNTWQPTSSGALAGACIGLIVLALLERWLSASRVMFESYWHERTSALTKARDQAVMTRRVANNNGSTDKYYLAQPEANEMLRRGSNNSPSPDALESKATKNVTFPSRIRTVVPFIAAHDIPRGILYALQMLIMYILMLAVMTFQAAYLISVILGLGLGEILFGRVGGGH